VNEHVGRRPIGSERSRCSHGSVRGAGANSHKDHNHDNNPPDGSNWELLCIYCHDNEHSRYLDEQWYDEATPGTEQKPASTHRPFSGLDELLKDKK